MEYLFFTAALIFLQLKFFYHNKLNYMLENKAFNTRIFFHNIMLLQEYNFNTSMPFYVPDFRLEGTRRFMSIVVFVLCALFWLSTLFFVYFKYFL